jgi:hypothetical protein
MRNFQEFGEFHNIGEWFGPYSDAGHRFDHINESARSFPEWSGVVKTHADYELFCRAYPGARVIYVLRDPRDVMVSWWHYLNNPVYYRNNPSVPFQGAVLLKDFLRQPATPFLRYSFSLRGDFSDAVGRWCSHAAGWMAADLEMLLIRYEDLSANFPKSLRQIGAFLGCEMPATPVRPTLVDGSGHLSRRGVPGDWINWMDAEDEQFVTARAASSGLKLALI